MQQPMSAPFQVRPFPLLPIAFALFSFLKGKIKDNAAKKPILMVNYFHLNACDGLETMRNA
jgi:hypothetical protein